MLEGQENDEVGVVGLGKGQGAYTIVERIPHIVAAVLGCRGCVREPFCLLVRFLGSVL